jgi:intein/homing endonuclease
MRLFQYKPKLSRQINEDGSIGKGIYLTIYSKKLVYELISLGLIPGNKVENQIKVPKWIKECKSYMIACLKGLFDTDGSIFPVIKEGAIKMNFKNGSLSLVEDFKEMTELFEIKTSKISSYSEITEKTNEFSITFILQIQARNQVKKFLDIINPMKWE